MTRRKRRILLFVLLLLATLGVAAGVLYAIACKVPKAYQPARLSQDQREQQAKEFVNFLVDFGNRTQHDQPFDWRIEQRRINWYLASMDEIAAQMPNGQPGLVTKAMRRAGLADPMVVIAKDKLTLMMRATGYDKVLSADISGRVGADGGLAVELLGVRVGELPVPQSMVRDELASLAELIEPSDGPAGGEDPAAIGSDDLGRLIATILRAIDGQDVEPVLTWPVNKKKVRVESVRLEEGAITLHVVPVEGERR